jgi:heptosyltransferase III
MRMDSIRPVNRIRRFITTALTRNIGKSERNRISGPVGKAEIKRILIVRPNHRLGNQLMVTPLVQELSTTFPDAVIDVFVKGGLASVVLQNYSCIDRIIKLPKEPFREFGKYIKGWREIRKQKYDIVINAARSSSSGKLATKYARSGIKFFGTDEAEISTKYADYKHVAKYPVYSLRNSLEKMGIVSESRQLPSVDMKLSVEELAKGKEIVRGLAGEGGKVLSLFTYATGPKCYTTEWWAEFHSKLKMAFPAVKIVEILPVENISMINFCEASFYSKDVREIAAVIANTDIFIGADSGIMHLSSSSLTPTFGLFSFTNPENYGPYNNGSMSIETDKMSFDEIREAVSKVLNG